MTKWLIFDENDNVVFASEAETRTQARREYQATTKKKTPYFTTCDLSYYDPTSLIVEILKVNDEMTNSTLFGKGATKKQIRTEKRLVQILSHFINIDVDTILNRL